MKKLIIDHFSLRSNELKVLKVLEIVYVFCTVALFFGYGKPVWRDAYRG